MAAIVPTMFKIIRVSDLGQEEVTTLAHDASRQGKVHYINTAGKAVVAQADTLAKSGATSTKGATIGIVSTKPRSSLAEESCTVLREADVWLGRGVLDAYDVGAPVFLSATVAGGLDSAAASGTNTTVVQIGVVVPSVRETGVDKLLRISTTRYEAVGSITVNE